MPATQYQPPVLQIRPQLQSYPYPRQPYPAYAYRPPPPVYYPYPRAIAGPTYSVRTARYYPNTNVRR